MFRKRVKKMGLALTLDGKVEKTDAPNIERQEIHCHNCDNYVQFNLDLTMNGNHVLKCPKCGHEHCRVVENGKVTDVRWDQRNGKFVGTPPNNLPVFAVQGNIQFSATSNYIVYTTVSVSANSTSASNIYMYQAWQNTQGTVMA
jgi:hypothetical protein